LDKINRSGETTMKRIGVAIPALNEESSISSIVTLCKKYASHVLVVDDGSTDRTAKLARFAGAEVISHHENLGKGKAISTAMKWAIRKNIDILVLIDADFQHDPAYIPDLVNPIIEGDADIIIGSRWRHQEGLREMPFHRIIGNWVLSTATSLSLSRFITDSQSGFRAFHRKTFKSFMFMVETGFGVESEMISIADEAGYKWIEFGITANYNDVNANTESPIRHGLRVLFSVMKLLRIHRPITFFGLASIILYLMAGVVVVYSRTHYQEVNLLPLGAMYLVSTLFIFGSFFMFIGILFQSVNRLYNRIFDIFLSSHKIK